VRHLRLSLRGSIEEGNFCDMQLIFFSSHYFALITFHVRL
jgi:hypothetical protein